ncbi:MAG: hypothetical protein ACPMAQ_11570 [Phycisphaerae bacterium]
MSGFIEDSGASLVFVFGGAPDLALLRTRTLENRFYVIAVSDEGADVIAPDGSALGTAECERPGSIHVTIDPARAADKRMAPRTDVFEQRRVRAFDF